MKHPTFDKIAPEILTGSIVCELILVAIYWFDILNGSQSQLHSLFDLDGEGNIPSWFSSVQLMIVALAFWTHALRQPRGLRPSKAFFGFAGCAALYASMDEAGQVHEAITAWLGRRYIDWLPNFTVTHFWMVMVVVALIMMVIQIFARDLSTLWRGHRRLVFMALLGVGIGLGGAMGVEAIGYKLLHGIKTTIWYKAEVSVEEFMEMLGGSLILFATLKLNGALELKRALTERRAARVARAGMPAMARASG
jgi:hypothetical protein